MSTGEFRDIVDADLASIRMHFTGRWATMRLMQERRFQGNRQCLSGKSVHIYGFVAYCYADEYEEGAFNAALLEEKPAVTVLPKETELKLDKLMKENAELREKLTSRREEQQQTYVPKPLDISEYKTRKIYIDTMLEDAGWIEGRNWLNEYKNSRNAE